MSDAQQFAAALILTWLAAILAACLLGALAGWWDATHADDDEWARLMAAVHGSDFETWAEEMTR